MSEQRVGEFETVFRYEIASRAPFAVVLFHGPLARGAVEDIERCEAELFSGDARLIVLSFNDAYGLERPLIAPLVKLQKHLRDKGRELRVCNLSSELSKALIDCAAVRESELCETIQDSLRELTACLQSSQAA